MAVFVSASTQCHCRCLIVEQLSAVVDVSVDVSPTVSVRVRQVTNSVHITPCRRTDAAAHFLTRAR